MAVIEVEQRVEEGRKKGSQGSVETVAKTVAVFDAVAELRIVYAARTLCVGWSSSCVK